MTEKRFSKDLDGIYGMILVQEATKEEIERYANGEYDESPTVGLVRIDVAVRYEDDPFFLWDYPREVWEVPFRVFVADPVWEDNPKEGMRRLHSEIGRLLEEDWDRLKEIWAGQCPRYAAPDDPNAPEM